MENFLLNKKDLINLNFSHNNHIENLINGLMVCIGINKLLINDKNHKDRNYGYRKFVHYHELLIQNNIDLRKTLFHYPDTQGMQKMNLLDLAIKLKKYKTARFLINQGYYDNESHLNINEISCDSENKYSHSYSFLFFLTKKSFFLNQNDKNALHEKILKDRDFKSLIYTLKHFNNSFTIDIPAGILTGIQVEMQTIKNKNLSFFQRQYALLDELVIHIERKQLNNNIQSKDKKHDAFRL